MATGEPSGWSNREDHSSCSTSGGNRPAPRCHQDNPTPHPVAFSTANDQTSGTEAVSLSPTFLILNPSVVERGPLRQWSGHLAWYYKSLNLLAEYGGSLISYAPAPGRESRGPLAASVPGASRAGV